MFKITKIVNNNIVCSVDSNGKEIILRGLGIGFKKQIGAVIPEDKIEKIYNKKTTKSNKALDIIENYASDVSYVKYIYGLIEKF